MVADLVRSLGQRAKLDVSEIVRGENAAQPLLRAGAVLIGREVHGRRLARRAPDFRVRGGLRKVARRARERAPRAVDVLADLLQLSRRGKGLLRPRGRCRDRHECRHQESDRTGRTRERHREASRAASVCLVYLTATGAGLTWRGEASCVAVLTVRRYLSSGSRCCSSTARTWRRSRTRRCSISSTSRYTARSVSRWRRRYRSISRAVSRGFQRWRRSPARC